MFEARTTLTGGGGASALGAARGAPPLGLPKNLLRSPTDGDRQRRGERALQALALEAYRMSMTALHATCVTASAPAAPASDGQHRERRRAADWAGAGRGQAARGLTIESTCFGAKVKAGAQAAPASPVFALPRRRCCGAGRLPSAAMETPYIGASISLISKSEIRYEGVLFTIDTKESTIALQNGALLAHCAPTALRRFRSRSARPIWLLAPKQCGRVG